MWRSGGNHSRHREQPRPWARVCLAKSSQEEEVQALTGDHEGGRKSRVGPGG